MNFLHVPLPINYVCVTVHMIVSHEHVTPRWTPHVDRHSLNLPNPASHSRYSMSAPIRAAPRRVASCRGIFSTTEPTNDHAVCIFPFRRYEVCGMILYAKSSLELIVNNRIGKVGIRPDGRPPSKPHHRRHHPVVHRPLCLPTLSLPP